MLSKLAHCFRCNLCLMKGCAQHYPSDEEFQIRNSSDFLQHALEASELGGTCFGVKGTSLLHTIFPEMPLSAPIDYMHQVMIYSHFMFDD